MRLNVLSLPCFDLWSSSVRRMSDRSTAPPGTSIDCKALMNALLRRLKSLSSGAPTTGVKAAWAYAKRSLASLGVVMVPTVRVAFRRRE